MARTNLTRFSECLLLEDIQINSAFKIFRYCFPRFKDLDLANINSKKYGVANDLKGNLIKARVILKNSIDSISLARALISRADKSFLCDKEYDVSIDRKPRQTKKNRNRKIKFNREGSDGRGHTERGEHEIGDQCL